MNELEMIKRQIKLKKQARMLIRDEIVELQIRLTMVILKERLEGQICNRFDPKLSKRLDCLNYLIES